MNANAFTFRNLLKLARHNFPNSAMPPHFLESNGLKSEAELEQLAASEAQQNELASERAARITAEELEQATLRDAEAKRKADEDAYKAKSLIEKREALTVTRRQLVDRIQSSPQLIAERRALCATSLRSAFGPLGGDPYSQAGVSNTVTFINEEGVFMEIAKDLVKTLSKELADIEKKLSNIQ